MEKSEILRHARAILLEATKRRNCLQVFASRVQSLLSSVASPICQEGQSERNFPIFAFSSRFFPSFPRFLANVCCQGLHSAPPYHPSGYATEFTVQCRRMVVILIKRAQPGKILQTNVILSDSSFRGGEGLSLIGYAAHFCPLTYTRHYLLRLYALQVTLGLHRGQLHVITILQIVIHSIRAMSKY